jgi:hypothetical protein
MPYRMSCCYNLDMLELRQEGGNYVKEGIAAHVGDLKRHADLGPKPKSVQPIRGEVYRASEKSGENPVRSHVSELQRQASLKGEHAPLQPIPEERKAAERLGTAPPDGENLQRFRLRRSEKNPDQWVLEDPAHEIIEGLHLRLEATPEILEMPPGDVQALFTELRVGILDMLKHREMAASGQIPPPETTPEGLQVIHTDFRLGWREYYKYLAKRRKQDSTEDKR